MSVVKKIKEIIKNVDFNNIPLMEKPSNEEISKNPYIGVCKLEQMAIMYERGRNMHTEAVGSIYGDKESWVYPKGVEKKVKDDKLYKIWYSYRIASDPMDSSCSYTIYYIEEISEEKDKLILYLEELLKKLKNE